MVGRNLLAILVTAQFLCTSLWFAGNTIIEKGGNGSNPLLLGHLTSAVQSGFIVGTLCYAVLTIADRYSPSKVFFFSAVLASLCNLSLVSRGLPLEGILSLRFLTGFFLAGIYPVGMKIAVDHYKDQLGKALGFIVGALVLGTALPHFLKSIDAGFSWQSIIITTSIMSFTGGITTLLFISDGPYRKRPEIFKLNTLILVFRIKNFRTVALGYFGHTWELYAFWAFVPQIILKYAIHHRPIQANIPLLSFIVIATGCVGCILSGYLSKKFDPKKLATLLLLLSCVCCLLSPLLFYLNSLIALIVVLVLWGIFAVSDSPLYSKLMAQSVPDQYKATALTIANCVGFFFTIVSIQLLSNMLKLTGSPLVFMLIGIGPLIGGYALISSAKGSVYKDNI